ncbi:hypothetical protein AAE02nite_10330 [Adhaeribacter aerolatus]|uniref:Uncharacterized protein n=2 Tax=Adhaeribacter aerolatus TaxID=670289 RepID=A0A512AUH7_9BACT|nr:hypothetical protein AAE02nite_10330 [Adhaeribacter aerolatus]
MDEDCSIPDNDELLARLTRMGQGWLDGGCHLVKDCFVPHPTKAGRLVNMRLLEERGKQAEWREKSSAGGKKSAQKRKEWRDKGFNNLKEVKGGLTTLEPPLVPKANITTPSSSSTSNKINAQSDQVARENDFHKFWNAYNKKVGKKKCQDFWNKLSDVTKEKIIKALPAYINKTPDINFRKDPLTWLRGEHWQDDLTIPLMPSSSNPLFLKMVI